MHAGAACYGAVTIEAAKALSRRMRLRAAITYAGDNESNFNLLPRLASFNMPSRAFCYLQITD